MNGMGSDRPTVGPSAMARFGAVVRRVRGGALALGLLAPAQALAEPPSPPEKPAACNALCAAWIRGEIFAFPDGSATTASGSAPTSPERAGARADPDHTPPRAAAAPPVRSRHVALPGSRRRCPRELDHAGSALSGCPAVTVAIDRPGSMLADGTATSAPGAVWRRAGNAPGWRRVRRIPTRDEPVPLPPTIAHTSDPAAAYVPPLLDPATPAGPVLTPQPPAGTPDAARGADLDLPIALVPRPGDDTLQPAPPGAVPVSMHDSPGALGSGSDRPVVRTLEPANQPARVGPATVDDAVIADRSPARHRISPSPTSPTTPERRAEPMLKLFPELSSHDRPSTHLAIVLSLAALVGGLLGRPFGRPHRPIED